MTAAERVMEINRGYRSVPTIVFPDGSHLTEPRTDVLKEKLGALPIVERRTGHDRNPPAYVAQAISISSAVCHSICAARPSATDVVGS